MVGAGIGGLCLAHGLLRAGADVLVMVVNVLGGVVHCFSRLAQDAGEDDRVGQVVLGHLRRILAQSLLGVAQVAQADQVAAVPALALENVLLGMTFTGRRHDPAWARHLLAEVGL